MMPRAHFVDGVPVRYRLVVPGVIGERRRAIRFVTAVCRRANVGADVEHDVVSAFGEAFNHAVLHSYRDAAGLVTVDVELARDSLVVYVRDRGHGWQHEDETARYGLFIMLRAMDEVRWYDSDGEHVALLAKKLHATT